MILQSLIPIRSFERRGDKGPPWACSMSNDSGKTISVVILIVLATILTRLLVAYYTNYTADDSFITFRYAENVAAGKGFVYNEGERVLGTSTPLYALLLALLVKLGLPIVLLGRLLNVAADCITGVLIFLLLRQYRFGVATLAAFFYVLFPRVVVWSISGMETSLYVLFIAATLYCYHKENLGLASLFLGLTFLTRVDGIILGLALLFHYVLRHRRFPTRLVLGGLALVLPWLIFSILYFGSPIPNSVAGKKALYSATTWETPQWRILWEFLFLKVKIGWPLLALALAGAYRALTRARSYDFIVLWSVLYFVFFFFAQTKIYIWYYVPFYLGYLIVVTFGVELTYERLNGVWVKSFADKSPEAKVPSGMAAFRTALISVVVIASVMIYSQQMRRTVGVLAAEQVVVEDINKKMGLWLGANTQPTDTICAEDIGYLGYYSERYILDQDGLVSPQAIPFNRKKDRLGLLKAYRPAYFLTGLSGPYFAQVIESEWLKRNYRMVAVFDPQSVDLDRAKLSLEGHKLHGCRYNVYQRVDAVN